MRPVPDILRQPTMSQDTGADRKAVDRRKRSIPVVRERRNAEQVSDDAPDNESSATRPSKRTKQAERGTREVSVIKEHRKPKGDDKPQTSDPFAPTREEITFAKAMEQYKRDNRRPFPTWSEVLEVLFSMGYRKVEEPTQLPSISPNSLPPKG